MDDDYSGVSDSSSESSTTTTIPAASNAILMLSLPDTPDEQENDQDVFETPPEYALVPTASQEQTPVLDLNRICNDDEESNPEELGDAVDLAESEAEIRVLKRNSSSEAESSPSKKSRVSEHDLGNSEEELETEPISLSNHNSNSDQTLPIASDDVKSVEHPQNSDSESDNAASEETQPVTEESGSPSGMEHSSQDGSDADSMDAQLRPLLPLSFFPSADSDEMPAKGCKWSDLLDVLKFLKEGSGEAGNEVNKCSFLEIAKRRGMTFPRL